LRNQGTLVAGVHAGYIDTDMTAALTDPKSSPDDIVHRVLAGIEHGDEEILADERSETLRAELLGNYAPFESAMQQTWDEYQRRITR
jgi:NAD(P)-dependent dehydrogenase (short-subunit alcohol dehydrogenase family)